MKPLVIPPAAQRDSNSVQMLSAWIAEQGLHCTINVGMWERSGQAEPRAWGILLADVMRHIADAIQQQHGHASGETLAGILASLNDELDEPTSPATGDFHHGHA